MKPLIGITVNYDYKDVIGNVSGLGAPLQDWDYIALDYAEAVTKAGGIPILIPNAKDLKTMKEVIGKIDGLLLSGGSDINPSLYGERTMGYCGPVFSQRDNLEMELIKEALRLDIPIFGICRGMQLLNVYFGGTMYQDIPTQIGGPKHSAGDIYMRNEPFHDVKVYKDSRLYKILGKTTVKTNSYHHQGVKDVCKNGVVVGTSEDGMVEAMEFSDKQFILAVQWHPEMMYDSLDTAKLFKAFINASKK